MAHGSDEKYALDLNDVIAFPDAAHLPAFPPEPGESWVLLMEVLSFSHWFFEYYHWHVQITVDMSFLGHSVFLVKDITQTEFVVTISTPNPSKDTRDFEIGHTLCMTSACLHRYLDGMIGFRINNPHTIEVRSIPSELVAHCMLSCCVTGPSGVFKAAVGDEHRAQAAQRRRKP